MHLISNIISYVFIKLALDKDKSEKGEQLLAKHRMRQKGFKKVLTCWGFSHYVTILEMFVNRTLMKLSRPTVAEQSKASVLRSWKRKVVGSNPGDPNLTIIFLLEIGSISLGRCKKETDSRRTGMTTIMTINNDNNKRRFESTFFNLDMWHHLQYFQNINVVL